MRLWFVRLRCQPFPRKSETLLVFRIKPNRNVNWDHTLTAILNLETPTFLFPVDRKYFENGDFRKLWRHNMCFPWPSFLLKHRFKMIGDCRVCKFLRRSEDGQHLLRFQSDTSVFKFLRRSANGPNFVVSVNTLIMKVVQWDYQLRRYSGHRKFFCQSVSVRMRGKYI